MKEFGNNGFIRKFSYKTIFSGMGRGFIRKKHQVDEEMG
jgi:hypothetical protein